jgi:SET domain-containing protein
LPSPVSPISRAPVEVDRSPVHGAGVFATRAYAAEDLIERCLLLIVPPEQAPAISESVLGDYVYEWEGGFALALGFGSLYNHAPISNARYEMDYDAEEIHIVAERPIGKGEEIFINYNGDPNNPEPVWFELDEDEDELVDEYDDELEDEEEDEDEERNEPVLMLVVNDDL